MQKILLATDLDGTLIGDGSALAELNKILTRLQNEGLLKLAYITGRSLESFLELKSNQLLLTPDALITAAGTEIYWHGVDLDKDWPSGITWNRAKIGDLLSDIKNLVLQEESAQRPYRIAYYLEDNNGESLDLIQLRLNLFPIEILYSHSKYLDITPKGINKGSALDSLASIWKIDISDVIACGDSANDISMLENRKAIIVNNALQELKDWAITTKNKGSEIYLAERSFAGGIVEGLRYYKIT
jgi:sucrose-6F-phosphate phosphohydrolase